MLVALLLLLAPFALAQKIVAARAGMLYYAEGTLSLDGRNLRSFTRDRLLQMNDGQTISSPKGHAEFLLGPNAVLWTGTGASVRFDDTSVADAAITVLDGAAMIEIKRTLAASRVRVRVGTLEVEVTRDGLYRFDSPAEAVRVYAGEALLPHGVKVSRGEEGSTTAVKVFDRKELDEFHYWAAYRSFTLEGDAGTFKQWGGSSWGHREHSGFGVKLPDAPGAARVKYLAASEAGLVYYLEGSAVVGGKTRTASTRLPMLLGRQNFLRTETAKAEIFLGVGVVARMAENTSLRMIETRSSSPVLELDEGSVLIEVADSAEGAPLRVHVGDSVTELLKSGLYLFDVGAGSLSVFGGEASTVLTGPPVRAREGQRVNLRQSVPPSRFDAKVHDALYKWSAERSFTLCVSPAAFMTPWVPASRPGWYKHKQFGDRRDPRPQRSRPRPPL